MTKPTITKVELERSIIRLTQEIIEIEKELSYLRGEGKNLKKAEILEQKLKELVKESKNQKPKSEEAKKAEEALEELNKKKEEFQKEKTELDEKIEETKVSIKDQLPDYLKTKFEQEEAGILKSNGEIEDTNNKIKNRQREIIQDLNSQKPSINATEYNRLNEKEKNNLVAKDPEVRGLFDKLQENDNIHQYRDLIDALEAIDKNLTDAVDVVMANGNLKDYRDHLRGNVVGGRGIDEEENHLKVLEELTKISTAVHDDPEVGLKMFKDDLTKKGYVKVDLTAANQIALPSDHQIDAVKDAMAALVPCVDVRTRGYTLYDLEEGLRIYRDLITDPAKAKADGNLLDAMNAVRELVNIPAEAIDANQEVDLTVATKMLDNLFPPVRAKGLKVPETLIKHRQNINFNDALNDDQAKIDAIVAVKDEMAKLAGIADDAADAHLYEQKDVNAGYEVFKKAIKPAIDDNGVVANAALIPHGVQAAANQLKRLNGADDVQDNDSLLSDIALFEARGGINDDDKVFNEETRNINIPALVDAALVGPDGVGFINGNNGRPNINFNAALNDQAKIAAIVAVKDEMAKLAGIADDAAAAHQYEQKDVNAGYEVFKKAIKPAIDDNGVVNADLIPDRVQAAANALRALNTGVGNVRDNDNLLNDIALFEARGGINDDNKVFNEETRNINIPDLAVDVLDNPDTVARVEGGEYFKKLEPSKIANFTKAISELDPRFNSLHGATEENFNEGLRRFQFQFQNNYKQANPDAIDDIDGAGNDYKVKEKYRKAIEAVMKLEKDGADADINAANDISNAMEFVEANFAVVAERRIDALCRDDMGNIGRPHYARGKMFNSKEWAALEKLVIYNDDLPVGHTDNGGVRDGGNNDNIAAAFREIDARVDGGFANKIVGATIRPKVAAVAFTDQETAILDALNTVSNDQIGEAFNQINNKIEGGLEKCGSVRDVNDIKLKAGEVFTDDEEAVINVLGRYAQGDIGKAVDIMNKRVEGGLKKATTFAAAQPRNAFNVHELEFIDALGELGAEIDGRPNVANGYEKFKSRVSNAAGGDITEVETVTAMNAAPKVGQVTDLTGEKKEEKALEALNALAELGESNRLTPQYGLRLLIASAERAGHKGKDQLSSYLNLKDPIIEGILAKKTVKDVASDEHKKAMQALADLSDDGNPDHGLIELNKIFANRFPDGINLHESVQFAKENNKSGETIYGKLKAKREAKNEEFSTNGVKGREAIHDDEFNELLASEQKHDHELIALNAKLAEQKKILQEQEEENKKTKANIEVLANNNPEIEHTKKEIEKLEKELDKFKVKFVEAATKDNNLKTLMVSVDAEFEDRKYDRRFEIIKEYREIELKELKDINKKYQEYENETEKSKKSKIASEIERLSGNEGYSEDVSENVSEFGRKLADIFDKKGNVNQDKKNELKNSFLGEDDLKKLCGFIHMPSESTTVQEAGRLEDFIYNIENASKLNVFEGKVSERLLDLLESGSKASQDFYNEALFSIVEKKLTQENYEELNYLNAKAILELSSKGEEIDEDKKEEAEKIVNSVSAHKPVKGSLADLYYRAALRGGGKKDLKLDITKPVSLVKDENEDDLDYIEEEVEEEVEEKQTEVEKAKNEAASKIQNGFRKHKELEKNLKNKFIEELKAAGVLPKEVTLGENGDITSIGNGILQPGVAGQMPNGAFSYNGVGAGNFSPTILVRNDGRGGVERRITLPDGVTSAWVHVDPHEMIGNDAIRMGDKIYEVKNIDSGRNSPNSVANQFSGQGNSLGSASSQGFDGENGNSNNGNSSSAISDKHNAMAQASRNRGEVTIEEAKNYLEGILNNNKTSKVGRMLSGLNGSSDEGFAEIKDNGMVVIKYDDLADFNEHIKNIRGKKPSSMAGSSKHDSFVSIVEIDVDGEKQHKIVSSDKKGVRIYDLEEKQYNKIMAESDVESVMNKVISEYASRGRANINEEMKKALLEQCDNEKLFGIARIPGRLGGRRDKLKEEMEFSGFSISDKKETVVERRHSDPHSVCVTINNGSTKDAFISLGNDAYVKVDASSGKAVPDTIFIKNGESFDEVDIKGDAFRLPLSYNGPLASSKLVKALRAKEGTRDGVGEMASDIMENYNNLKLLVCKGEVQNDKYVPQVSFQVDGKTHGLKLTEEERYALAGATFVAAVATSAATMGTGGAVGVAFAAAATVGSLGYIQDNEAKRDEKNPNPSPSQPLKGIAMKGQGLVKEEGVSV